ncbi:MAG: SLC13 family permease [Tropicimonas sp.]|uniref:SLC13 family permease n=1 Tax=Tropicimonas sp. TaxID=2067044 RepID=UPI003A887FF8
MTTQETNAGAAPPAQPTAGSPDDKQKSLLNRYGIFLAAAVFLMLYLMPTPEGLEPEGQKALAVFCTALTLWVAGTIPIYLTSMLAIVGLALTGTVSEKTAFGTLGFNVIWLMVSAFVLTSAMVKSNLASRFALWMVTRFGGTPTRTLAILVLINFVIVFFIPSTTARASLMVPICIILLEIYKAVPGRSNFGKLMMLQGVQADALATSGVMTGTAANMIAVQFIFDQAGGDIGYMDWLIAGMPMALLSMFLTFLVGLRLFRFGDEVGFDAGMSRLEEQRRNLGAISLDEKKAMSIFLFTVTLWATEDYHEALFNGFEISIYVTAVIAAILCLMPRIGLLEWKEANIKWDLMIFAAGAYAAGNALESTGGAQWVIGGLVYGLGLENMSTTLVYVVVIFLSTFSHMIFTSKTVRTTILIPAFIALAKTLNMDPVTLALAASFTLTYTITLPPHSKVNTLYFATGYFSVLEQLKYGIITCLIGSAVISASVFTWFRLLGYGL